MDDQAELGLFRLLLFHVGPLHLLAILFASACTFWLVVSRIQRVRRIHPRNTLRDLTLLSTGPVAGVLTSVSQVCTAGKAYLWGDKVSGPPPVIYLDAAQALAFSGMFLFIVGVIACCLPIKSDANVA